MADKIRLGFVGANVNSIWSSQSHYPALLASPDVELTAVCTSRPESAEEARQAFGAKLAFHDFREMAVSPEIDAVAVVVSATRHRFCKHLNSSVGDLGVMFRCLGLAQEG